MASGRYHLAWQVRQLIQRRFHCQTDETIRIEFEITATSGAITKKRMEFSQLIIRFHNMYIFRPLSLIDFLHRTLVFYIIGLALDGAHLKD